MWQTLLYMLIVLAVSGLLLLIIAASWRIIRTAVNSITHHDRE